MSFQHIACLSQISAQPCEMTALRGEKYYRESEDDQGRLYCGWLQARYISHVWEDQKGIRFASGGTAGKPL